MTEREYFPWLLGAWFAVAVGVFILLFFVNAPYGRYLRRGWGPTLDNTVGWLLMEAPAAVFFFVFFFTGKEQGLVPFIFLFMWEAHYLQRAFVYPFSLHVPSRQMPILVVAMGLTFNILNTYFNGRYLFSLHGGYSVSWLRDPRFIAGLLIFIAGYFINRRSDSILSSLRKSDQNGYAMPYGGMYRWVSCPNYLGEVVIWSGWAIATWSVPGLAFAIWTLANLAPRARANHAWYKSHFADYPPDRKALIPGLW
jgi:hypothetical protein